ncbi:unnamed protein product [Arctia plantaginis]|uniref:Uncharacterized protein n=1 Tax=Arctia plantaginis TaxID=874455 RepID=A0A8S1B3J1_ARCPL|nr:unnamed protein product [Arctia plantaginis]
MVKVLASEVKRFMTECLKSAGAKTRPAKQQADLLIYADKMGLATQGLNKLDSCVNDIKSGLCLPNNKPVVLKMEPSASWIDAKNVMAATAGHFAMERAIKIANKTGVGWVLATGCNHDAEPFSYWVKQATDRGLIGLAFSAYSSFLQEQLQLEYTEPLYIGSGKNELVPVSDVRIVYGNQNIDERSLRSPISEIISSGYKKRGFETMLEVLGFPGKENLQSWSAEPLTKKLVNSFVAVNPTCFALGIDSRYTKFVEVWKQWDEMDPKLPELLENNEGVLTSHLDDQSLSYKIHQINASLNLAHKLGVKPMELQED